MFKPRFLSAGIGIALALTAVGAASPASAQSEQQSAREKLTADLLAIARAAPEGDTTVEGRLALALAQANLDCPTTLAAISAALAGEMPASSHAALTRLKQISSHCRNGTGAVGSHFSGIGGAPSFSSGGGGADYSN